MFIDLNLDEKNKVSVNILQIKCYGLQTVNWDKSATYVLLGSSDERLLVKETPEEIKSRITFVVNDMFYSLAHSIHSFRS